MNQKIIEYLIRLKKIYLALDENSLRKDIDKLESMIGSLQGTQKPAEPKQKNNKNSFKDSYSLLLEKKYQALVGTKLNFEQLTSEDNIVRYFESNPKTKIIKDATALDLKLIYSLLTNDPNEIKGTKNVVYDAIKRNIRARRRGEAFMKTV